MNMAAVHIVASLIEPCSLRGAGLIIGKTVPKAFNCTCVGRAQDGHGLSACPSLIV